MGRKITIDSATLFNKGLEMIEARWLFDIGMDRVQGGRSSAERGVSNGGVCGIGPMLAQMSTPDMCLPIQYALTYPARVRSDRVQTNLAKTGPAHFLRNPDTERFPSLNLARRAGRARRNLACGLNAANEVRRERVPRPEKINFPQISEIVGRVMDSQHTVVKHPDLKADPRRGRLLALAMEAGD